MKLISMVSSDHDDTSGCDYALIDVDADLARLALKRVGTLKAEKQRDPNLDEMYYWDHHVEYFSPWNAKEEDRSDSLSEALDKLPAVGDELMLAPDDFIVPENLLGRVECPEMTVRQDAIAFVAIPKHASYYIRTAEIPIRMIEVAAVA